MDKIIFERQEPLFMSIIQKCADKLPKWDDIRGTIPFFITGSVGVAFFLIDRAERKRELQKKKKSLDKQRYAETQGNSVEEITTPSGIDQTKATEEQNNYTKQEQNQFGEKNGQEKQDIICNRFPKQPSKQQIVSSDNQKKSVNHFGELKQNTDLERSTKKMENNLESSMNLMNNAEYEFFNSNKGMFGDEGTADEIGKNTNNEQGSDIGSSQNLKTLQPREKRQKRAPIKINRNFATDTENNEKLQKLKSIVQKEKKLEDKVFFQMFLNIVGTEADEDNDD